jgi:hypothetical protein
MARIAALSGAGSFSQTVTIRVRSGLAGTLVCVSGCVPAAQHPCKIWRREGDSNPTKSLENIGDSANDSRIDSRTKVAVCPQLSQVVAAWSNLPPSLKAAILAIVGSVTSSPEVEP